MTRREALAACSALGLPAWGAGLEIMDTHVHFYDPFRPGGVPWPRKEEKILYRRAMPEDYEKVSTARVLIVEASPLFSDNQWILDVAAKHSFIGGCIGHLDPANPEFEKHVEQFHRNAKFLGIRLSTKAAEPVVAKLGPLAKAGLTLDLIGNGEMYAMAARISDRYPGLRIVLDHLPLAQRDASIGELRSRQNIYAKVSWILRSREDSLSNHLEALDEVWRVFGEDRVVYGSNWPVSDMVVPYGKVQETAIEYFSKKPVAKYPVAKYLHANSRAAYRWT